MKCSVTVKLKKEVQETKGKVVQNTIQNLGIDNTKRDRQDKDHEIEINDKYQTQAEKNVDDMCKKLLANLIIEDYKINKI